ncbi:ATP-grasp domain-containing protein [Butyrivibrio sp. JL13D10]|uniref:ATP-grasp domain-containing protein n=1 Tax=Butyrivibrio sp. JL13D10 TaxID=3236815 RepID=UPI0038B57229
MGKNKEKRKIIIYKCYSSAVNYIHDIRMLGYEPVLLEPFIEDEAKRIEMHDDYTSNYKFNGDICPEVIMEKPTYEEALEMIKEINPILILPGADNALWLCMKVSGDLGLKSNSLENYMPMRDKYHMQKALKEADLKSMDTVILHSEDEALSFFISHKGKKVVLKPTEGAATAGVHICDSAEQVKVVYKVLEKLINDRERDGETVVGQVFYEGPEYAIDTISCEGNHVVLYGWKYKKKVIPLFGTIYDQTIYISPDKEEYTEIIEYVFNVLDAIGIKYGAVHTEVIVTDDGPVLVEVNCRPGGGFQKYTYQDKIMFEHETKVSLDSYLMEPCDFLKKYPEKMPLKQPGIQKDIILDRDIYVEKVTITEACRNLPSFEYAIDNGAQLHYAKTIDFETNGGTIFLTDSDERQIQKDLEYIYDLEKNHLELLYQYRDI